MKRFTLLAIFSALAVIAITIGIQHNATGTDTKREKTGVVTAEVIPFLLKNGYAQLKPTADPMVLMMVVPIDDNGPVGPQPEPIICDGMTWKQLEADIFAQSDAYKLSAAYQQQLAVANATCIEQNYCIANCAMAYTFIIKPTRLKCNFNWVGTLKPGDKYTLVFP
ncbi:hypothetical protein LX64_01473 [Chitinophaga skermanii]|uniref:Uncharacterized protein n=2 Tax=Chitinophaga skermanii TaxID=331697 RepID=A0A327QW43_9BACT|nr:hypothetical protein LX64_01473 [Chitinophaga skermanii]